MQLLIPLSFSPLPIFDQVPCESHLKKHNKLLHFPSLFPVPLSGATLRDFLSTHSRLKVKIVKLHFSLKGSMHLKLGNENKKKKVKISFFLVLLKHESEQCLLLWMRKKTVTFRPALFRFGILSICSSNLRSLPWLGEISKTSEKD